MGTAVKTKTHTEYRKCNGIYTLVDWKSGPLTCQRPDSVVFVVNQTEISASVTQEMLFLIKGTRIRISLHICLYDSAQNDDVIEFCDQRMPLHCWKH